MLGFLTHIILRSGVVLMFQVVTNREGAKKVLQAALAYHDLALWSDTRQLLL